MAGNLQARLCDALAESLAGRKPVLPAGGELLWTWFLDLNRMRTYHAAGPNPLQYSEIRAYAALSGWPIAQRHVAILVAMDEAWMANLRTVSTQAPGGVKTMPPISKRPISAGLVDAMFGGGYGA